MTNVGNVNDILANAVLTVLSLAITALIAALIAWVQKRFSREKIGLGAEIARTAVTAAEQMGKTAGWNGTAKLEQASSFLVGLAAKVGLNFTPVQIRGLIETAVHDLTQWQTAALIPGTTVMGTVETFQAGPLPAAPPPGEVVPDGPDGKPLPYNPTALAPQALHFQATPHGLIFPFRE